MRAAATGFGILFAILRVMLSFVVQPKYPPDVSQRFIEWRMTIGLSSIGNLINRELYDESSRRNTREIGDAELDTVAGGFGVLASDGSVFHNMSVALGGNKGLEVLAQAGDQEWLEERF